MSGERSAHEHLMDWVDNYYLCSQPYVLICAPQDERWIRRLLDEQIISTGQVQVVPTPGCDPGKLMIIDPRFFMNPDRVTPPPVRTPGSPCGPEPSPPPASP